jgi:hypothetical protein
MFCLPFFFSCEGMSSGQRWSSHPPARCGLDSRASSFICSHEATVICSYSHIVTTSPYAHIAHSSYAHSWVQHSYQLTFIHSYFTFICSHEYNIHMLTWVHIHMSTLIFIFVDLYMHMYTHIHTHTHIYTYRWSCGCFSAFSREFQIYIYIYIRAYTCTGMDFWEFPRTSGVLQGSLEDI